MLQCITEDSKEITYYLSRPAAPPASATCRLQFEAGQWPIYVDDPWQSSPVPPCSAASFCRAVASSMRSTARSAAMSSASCCLRRCRRWYDDACVALSRGVSPGFIAEVFHIVSASNGRQVSHFTHATRHSSQGCATRASPIETLRCAENEAFSVLHPGLRLGKLALQQRVLPYINPAVYQVQNCMDRRPTPWPAPRTAGVPAARAAPRPPPAPMTPASSPRPTAPPRPRRAPAVTRTPAPAAAAAPEAPASIWQSI